MDTAIPVTIKKEPSHRMSTASLRTSFFKLQLLQSHTPQALWSEVEWLSPQGWGIMQLLKQTALLLCSLGRPWDLVVYPLLCMSSHSLHLIPYLTVCVHTPHTHTPHSKYLKNKIPDGTSENSGPGELGRDPAVSVSGVPPAETFAAKALLGHSFHPTPGSQARKYLPLWFPACGYPQKPQVQGLLCTEQQHSPPGKGSPDLPQAGRSEAGSSSSWTWSSLNRKGCSSAHPAMVMFLRSW